MNWLYNEFQQIGKDYSLEEEVKVYDETHSHFRDIHQESNELLKLLNVTDCDVLVDFGSGSGVFAIEAAKVCKKVYAVDISQNMLSLARNKAICSNVENIEFVHSGFLNFALTPQSVDYITSTFSFHHLPDFWKKVALEKMNSLLKDDGILFIKDVIIEDSTPFENINRFIAEQEKLGGVFLKEDAEQHFREEYSTFDWVIDSLLERSGFSIQSKSIEKGLIASYLCVKSTEHNKTRALNN